MSVEVSTLKDIIKAGREEFLSKGFEGASLRKIVKNAGVTTGAFYGYFSSKEELFSEIADVHAKEIMSIFNSSQEKILKLADDKNFSGIENIPVRFMHEVTEYIYKNFTDCKIMLCCSGGTKYENFVHNLVELEVDMTLKLVEILAERNDNTAHIDRQMCHIIISGMYMGMFEVVEHDMEYEKAVQYVDQLERFYAAGWAEILQTAIM